MTDAITFGTIRKYVSKIDRVSICNAQTLQYENYLSIEEVPHDYDRYYLYGFGLIESEFGDDRYAPDRSRFKTCVEIRISERPRRDPA